MNMKSPSEIRDFRMSRMSGIEISSSQGLKKPPKISPRDVKLTLPRAVGPREVSFSSHGLILRFFSTRGMKKFLYLTSTAIRKTYSCLSLYMWKICFFREIVMRTRYPGGNYHFSPGKILAWGEITISPRVTSAHDDFTEKNRFCTYINSNRNRFSEWPLMSGIEISSSRGL